MDITNEDIDRNDQLFAKLDWLFKDEPHFQIVLVVSRVLAIVVRENSVDPEELLANVLECMKTEMASGDKT